MGNKVEGVILEAKNENNENIKPLGCAKILGITFANSLNWREFLELGKDAMIPNSKRN